MASKIYTADKFIITGGTSAEYLRADGTVGTPSSGGITGGGAVNQIAFWSSATNIIGESSLYWDYINDRLGVKTSTPQASVDINGTLSVGANLAGVSGVYNFVVNGADAGIFLNRTAAPAFIRLTQDSLGGGQIKSLSGGGLSFTENTGVTARLNIGSTGGILINQTTDDLTNKLQVTGGVKITGILSLTSTVTNGTYTYTLPSSTGTLALTSAIPSNMALVSGTPLNAYVAFFNGTTNTVMGSTALYFDNTNKRLGINLGTVPAYKLDISASAASDGVRVQNTLSTGLAAFIATNNSGVSGTASYGVTGSSYVTYGALLASNTTLYTNLDIVLMADATSKVIKFAAGGNVEKARITTTGLIIGGSAVIDDITNKLQVTGNTKLTGNLTVTISTFTPLISVGTTTASSYPVNVATEFAGVSVWCFGDLVSYSDISVKENIKTIPNALERVLKSRGVIYDRIDSGAKNNIGFIAQELELEFPELVIVKEDGTKSVKYQNAVAVLFEAVKEQQKLIEDLKDLVNKLIATK